MLFDSNAAPGLSATEAVVDLLARAGRGMSIRAISRHLGVSASTASRRIRALRDQQWVISTEELEGIAIQGDERDLHLTLNPNRPGLAEYLKWMHIEHGTEPEAYWGLIEELRGGYHARAFVRLRQGKEREADERANAMAATVRDLLPTLHGEPLPAPYFRVFALKAEERVRWRSRIEGYFQELFRSGTDESERYRDFIHVLVNMDEDLQPIPSVHEQEDARPELAVLAMVAQHNARVLAVRAQAIFEAGLLGVRRNVASARLASWARSQVLGSSEPFGTFLRPGDELLESERLRHIDAQMDARSPTGWRYYGHGGAPGRPVVGSGGDTLFAKEMLDQALHLQAVVDGIRKLPGMDTILNSPDVASYMEKAIPEDLVAPTVPANQLELEMTSHRRVHDDGKLVENMSEELTVAGDELRIGDRILAIDGRRLGEPLVVNSFPAPGKVALAKGMYFVPVTTAGLLEDKSVMVRRSSGHD